MHKKRKGRLYYVNIDISFPACYADFNIQPEAVFLYDRKALRGIEQPISKGVF
jgi:hypothetical protein